MRRRATEAALLMSLFVVGTIAMVRPSLHLMSTSIPANLGDPALITWILHWGAHSLTTAPVHYFSANIFWPHPSALAYSDLLTPLVPIYGLTYGLTHSWTVAIDTTVLFALSASLAATYGLLRWLTGNRGAAIVGSFAFTFSGFTMSEWGHIQLDTLGLLPLGALMIGLVLERRRLMHAVLLGVVNAMVVLAAIYYGVIWMVSLGIIVAGYLVVRRGRGGPRLARCLFVAAAVSALLTGPAAYKYLQLQRTEGHTRGYSPELSLKARDLITPANGSYLWSSLDPASGVQLREHGFYPGFSVVALAAVGAASLLSRGRRRTPPTEASADSALVDPSARSTMVGLLMAAGAMALVLAVGPTVHGHAAPYRFFHDHVPGFAGIRVTARFAVVSLLAGAVLAAVGWQSIVERVARPRIAFVLSAAMLICVCVDLAAPLAWWKLPVDRPTLAVYRALSHRPPGAVVELPMGDPRAPEGGYPYIESPRMVYSTLDWHPRVNGYSAFVPSTYLGDIDAFAALPATTGFDHAKTLAVRYLVLHVGDEHGYPAFSEEAASRIVAAAPTGSHSSRFGSSWLIDLGG